MASMADLNRASEMLSGCRLSATQSRTAPGGFLVVSSKAAWSATASRGFEGQCSTMFVARWPRWRQCVEVG